MNKLNLKKAHTWCKPAEAPAHLLFALLNLVWFFNSELLSSFLQDIKACVDDLNNLLKVESKNTAALKLLQEVQKKWRHIRDSGDGGKDLSLPCAQKGEEDESLMFL